MIFSNKLSFIFQRSHFVSHLVLFDFCFCSINIEHCEAFKMNPSELFINRRNTRQCSFEIPEANGSNPSRKNTWIPPLTEWSVDNRTSVAYPHHSQPAHVHQSKSQRKSSTLNWTHPYNLDQITHHKLHHLHQESPPSTIQEKSASQDAHLPWYCNQKKVDRARLKTICDQLGTCGLQIDMRTPSKWASNDASPVATSQSSKLTWSAGDGKLYHESGLSAPQDRSSTQAEHSRWPSKTIKSAIESSLLRLAPRSMSKGSGSLSLLNRRKNAKRLSQPIAPVGRHSHAFNLAGLRDREYNLNSLFADSSVPGLREICHSHHIVRKIMWLFGKVNFIWSGQSSFRLTANLLLDCLRKRSFCLDFLR